MYLSEPNKNAQFLSDALLNCRRFLFENNLLLVSSVFPKYSLRFKNLAEAENLAGDWRHIGLNFHK